MKTAEQWARDIFIFWTGGEPNRGNDRYEIEEISTMFKIALAEARKQALEEAAHAARVAMVGNKDADELTCSICAAAIRQLADKVEA